MEDLINQCPNCQSSDIHIDMQADGPIVTFDDNKISALKIDAEKQNEIEISCNNCESNLIATKTGYRLK